MSSIDTEIEATIDHLAEATEALKKARRHDRETCSGYLFVGRRVMGKAMARILRLAEQVNQSADDPVVQFSPSPLPTATETQEVLAVPTRLRGKMKPERAHIFAKLEVLEVGENVVFPLPAGKKINALVDEVCGVQAKVKEDTGQTYTTRRNKTKTAAVTTRLS